MVKKALYLLTAVLMFTCSTMKVSLFKKYTPDVEPQLQKYFVKLDSIYDANDIKIDYKKISTIQVMDSVRIIPGYEQASLEGLYNRITKKIYINTNQMPAFWAGKYEDMILLIMAHEIGHSQGIGHTSNPCSIMFPSSLYSLELMHEHSTAHLVTDIYITDYPLLEEE